MNERFEEESFIDDQYIESEIDEGAQLICQVDADFLFSGELGDYSSPMSACPSPMDYALDVTITNVDCATLYYVVGDKEHCIDLDEVMDDAARVAFALEWGIDEIVACNYEDTL